MMVLLSRGKGEIVFVDDFNRCINQIEQLGS